MIDITMTIVARDETGWTFAYDDEGRMAVQITVPAHDLPDRAAVEALMRFGLVGSRWQLIHHEGGGPRFHLLAVARFDDCGEIDYS